MDKFETNAPTINKKLEINVKSCPVDNVTVFVDRAEVNRLVDVDLENGNNEILLKNLPENIDSDSIRYINYLKYFLLLFLSVT